MSTWRQSAEDPRGTDELIRVALTELDLSDEELRSATGAVVALQFRPTREVLDRACELCRSADVDERRLGVVVLGELRDLADVASARPAFIEESMQMLLALAATEPNTDVLVEVARAFGFRRDPRAVEPLLLRVRDPDVSAAGEALVGLAMLGDERAIAPLIEYLEDPDPYGAVTYGLDAATALAAPRLLPTLRTLEQRLGDRPDLRQAILACTEGS